METLTPPAASYPSNGRTNGIEDRISIRRYDPSTTDFLDERNYALLWIKSGVEAISIDRERFVVQPRSLFCVVRGTWAQLHYGSDPQGWILKFSDEIFHEITRGLALKDAEILSSFGQVLRIILSPNIEARVAAIAEMIDELIGSEMPKREIAITSLLRTLLIYCDSKCNVHVAEDDDTNGVQMVTQYKDLVSRHFTETHRVEDYAEMMNITPKYLYEVTNNILGVTAKSIIKEQVTIQARRDLKFSNDSVKEIAFRLGFSEPSHFSKYFKKQVGCSPSEYRLQ